MAWQKKRLEVPEDYTPADRERLAREVIDFIRERTTEQNRGVKNGRNFKFPAYSESYIKSSAFQKAGKSKGRVDLKLTGEMLDSIKLISHKKGSVLIGFENGSFANDKAEGNAKKRPFLDITQRDLDKIIKDVDEQVT